MPSRSLKVSYRKGVALAAYLYLRPRKAGEVAASTRKMASDLVVDFSVNDEPMGVEILAPGHVTVEEVNLILLKLGTRPVTADDLRPILSPRDL